VPEATLFFPDPITGERSKLLQRMNIRLSELNDNDLARADKVLTALTE
jgi:hypothetical protein